MTGGEMTPFRWVVSQDEIDDLYARLDKTRWPQQLKSPANDDWLYGTELGYLQELSWYWRNAFDIQRHVAKFNRMPQFTTEVRGRRLHFVHRPCARAGAPALLLAHGWPGSVFEFYKMVEPLAEDFHVVAPSIPGYAWSAPPEHRGHTYVETARDYHILMLKLGYTKYNVHGGDWGSLIVKSMAVLYPRNVLALHTTMPIGLPPPAGVTDPPLTRDELVGLQRTADFRKFGAAYQQIQGSKPQTLAYGLTDSPVGLLGWIVEKMRSWTDNDGDPTMAVTKDEILTNVMVYWCSQCIGPSIRYYMENGTGTSKVRLWCRFLFVIQRCRQGQVEYQVYQRSPSRYENRNQQSLLQLQNFRTRFFTPRVR
eukprot:m.110840 g.110840  ORF g.110840 m.110840 type:complete len:367 (+) comp12905_c0_seq3:35-1135(+)